MTTTIAGSRDNDRGIDHDSVRSLRNDAEIERLPPAVEYRSMQKKFVRFYNIRSPRVRMNVLCNFWRIFPRPDGTLNNPGELSHRRQLKKVSKKCLPWAAKEEGPVTTDAELFAQYWRNFREMCKFQVSHYPDGNQYE